jgi:5-oxopent-3-ene-1,2,5-tricarboxylate decarboxylase / 2-hydroxyhepta-2,4-diene-1,7-dioate isomerase
MTATHTDWIAAFAGVGTGTVASLLTARGYPRQFIAGLRRDGRAAGFAGPARTLRLVPRRPDLVLDHDAYREAIEATTPGSVLAVDGHGQLSGGVIGDILAARMRALGGVGLVTDGAVRDTPGLADLDLAVYSRGADGALRSSWWLVGGTQEPIVCGGVAIIPGDILVGDADGVIAVPRDLAEEVAREGRDTEEFEVYITGRVVAGEPLDGLYPPNDDTRVAYERWRETGTEQR